MPAFRTLRDVGNDLFSQEYFAANLAFYDVPRGIDFADSVFQYYGLFVDFDDFVEGLKSYLV